MNNAWHLILNLKKARNLFGSLQTMCHPYNPNYSFSRYFIFLFEGLGGGTKYNHDFVSQYNLSKKSLLLLGQSPVSFARLSPELSSTYMCRKLPSVKLIFHTRVSFTSNIKSPLRLTIRAHFHEASAFVKINLI